MVRSSEPKMVVLKSGRELQLGVKVKLTTTLLKDLLPREAAYEVLDSELRGFGVRVSPKGLRTFFLRWSLRDRDGRKDIANFGDMTEAEARTVAESWRGVLARGEDPRAASQALRQSPTMEKFWTRFLEEYATEHLKATTIKSYTWLWNKHMLPFFGKLKVKEVTGDHVSRFHAKHAATKRQANLMISVLSKMLRLAEQWSLREPNTNPCPAQKKFHEEKRERYLTDAEIQRLGAALKLKTRGAMPAAALRLMILTGARRGELEQLTWSQVHLDEKHPLLVIPAAKHKTGRKTQKARTIALDSVAAGILKDLSRVRLSKWVFPGKDPKKPMAGLNSFWQRLRVKVHLEDVHMHDLRHTFATTARRRGVPLETITDLLGHTDVRMAKRYAHIEVQVLTDAVEKAAEGLGSALGIG